jgi:hypothetical protein
MASPVPLLGQSGADPASLASDLVQDMKLDTTFADGKTLHMYHASDPRLSRRSLRIEEHWRSEQLLGRGTYGAVYLETCVLGPRNGQLRAVKRIAKDGHAVVVDYSRELVALSKFSHKRVSPLDPWVVLFVLRAYTHVWMHAIGH